MGLELNRWLRYTRARVRAALDAGNDRLDELEAQREAERAERPWLSSDGEDLSFDQVKARIEWEERAAARGTAADRPTGTGTGTGDGPASGDAAAGAGARDGAGAGGGEATAEELTPAVDDLRAREAASKARLEAIRRELGVDPGGPGAAEPPVPDGSG